MQPQWEYYLQQYSNRTYTYTTMVRHAGVLVAFALDTERRLYYTVLDQQNEPDPIDARNWSTSPQPLVFPNEIAQVGFGLLANKVLPFVRANGEPARSPSEVDLFLSTTARLTAAAPFQVLSDNQYIYLFRQAIDANHPDRVTVPHDEGEAITQVPIVNETLLVDRFILSGTQLKTVREVRYRRSRHKLLPAGPKDTLSAVDMNNQPFYEPTLELEFVRNISRGRFAVVQVPTAIPDVKRWQIFVHNEQTGRIDAYNVERSSDGWFNTQGTESPSAFARMGHAETALELDATSYVEGRAQVLGKTDFTISFWLKPKSTGVIYSEGVPNSLFSIRIVDTTLESDGGSIAGRGLEVSASSEGKNVVDVVRSVPNVIHMGEWNHISVSLTPAPDFMQAPEDAGLVRMQVDDAVVNDDGDGNQYLVFPSASAPTTYLCIGQNIGALHGGTQPADALEATIDEVSIWDRGRLEAEIRASKNIRKVGNEPGLITYWQFDEGHGTTVYDQTDTVNHGILQGSPMWVQSDAPIGDNPGIRRTSFGFHERTIAGAGISSLLYYPQEEAPSGHDGTPTPIKQSARVLLAMATGRPTEELQKIAVLDFAVDKRGRLSQVPDTIDLARIRSGEVDFNALLNQAVVLESEVRSLEAQIALLRGKLDRTRADIAARQARIRQLEANPPFPIYGSQRVWRQQIDALQAEVRRLQEAETALQMQILPQEELLAMKHAEVRIVREELRGDKALPMPLIHIDPNGFSVLGGLLDFAWTNDAPKLFDSASGMLRVYFRGSDDQFFSATYDTNVSRASLVLSNSVQLRERSPGLGRNAPKVMMPGDLNPDATTVTITDGVDANTCSVMLSNNMLGITETWERVPRNPSGLAHVLSGQARQTIYLGRLKAALQGTIEMITMVEPVQQRYERGASLVIGQATVRLRRAIAAGETAIAIESTPFAQPLAAGTTLNIVEYDYERYSTFTNKGNRLNAPYDLRYGSSLVELSWSGNGNVENLPTTPLAGLSRPTAWIAESPGNALVINSGYLTGIPASRGQLAHQGDISLEAWIRPDVIESDRTAFVIEQHTSAPTTATDPPASNYVLGIQGQRPVTALAFDGVDDYIGPNLANQSFTVEFWAKRDPAGLNVFFSSMFALGAPRTNQQLHFGFRQNGAFAFAFYGNDLNTPPGFMDTDWHHWACTFDVQTLNRVIYRDGTIIAEDTASAPYQGSGNLLIGTINNPSNQHFFHGALDEIRIWNRVRSQAEIDAAKDCRLDGEEAGLVAYYYFENGEAINRAGDPAYHGRISGGPRQVDSALTYYNVFAGVRNRYVMVPQPLWVGSWEHLAATYSEAYALGFNGVDSYLDCGNRVSLGTDDALTIEMTAAFPATGRMLYPLLQKGRLGMDDPELTCWLYVRRESASRYHLYFGYEDANGMSHVASASVDPPPPNTPVRIAVTGAGTDEAYTVRLYWNGQAVGNAQRFAGGPPVASLQPLEVGRCSGTPQGTTNASISGAARQFLLGTISELRVWNRALRGSELHQRNAHGDKLVGHWTFTEGSGALTTNRVDGSEARLIGAAWVPDPDRSSTRLDLYINGMPAQTREISPLPIQEDRFSLARNFQGKIDEVRIWKELRTHEHILDNLFGPLKGERDSLLAYYAFESDPTSAGNVIAVHDGSLRGNTLMATPEAEIRHVLSQAPLSDDIALVRHALGSVRNRFQGRITNRPAIEEYADIQTAKNGAVRGVHKRCYSFIDRGRWQLLTGYKVGNLITEWISQVQFDPQLKGYIEGAPPVPSENLTAGPINDATSDYVNTTSVEFVEAESVSYTLSTSRESGFSASFEASIKAELAPKVETVIAPFGGGISLHLGEGKTSLSASTKLDTELKWSSTQQQGYGTNLSKMTSVSLGGNWEHPAIAQRLNKAMPRRYQPANVGFALVESETADLYAIRLAHNRTLVAFRMVPNADIPKDTNIIPFPINPRYTKQGTLDGAVGYARQGKVLDPDYPEAAAYGEYSYFKPSEAYALRRRIQAEEVRLRTFYEDFSTTPPDATGVLAGGVGGTLLESVSRSPVAAPLVAAAGMVAGGLIDALASDNDLPARFGRRNIVNSYVWTADGGLYAESTQTIDTQQESTSGSYNLTGQATAAAATELGVFGVNIGLETKASFGGSLNLTKAKTSDASQSFSLNLVNNTPGDLQTFTLDAQGNLVRDGAGRPVREYDADGNPINTPGKVDAYRFLTFYLTPTTHNYDAFFHTVVDPIWLEQSNSPNARALRQARQPQGGPACWRIFHRVTFVSRILPEFPDPTAPPLDRAIQDTDLSSSYELIRRLEPFVRHATGSAAEFDAAVRSAVRLYLPEPSGELTQEVIRALAAYFGVEGID